MKRGWVVLAVACVALLGLPAVASAHASYKDSDPQDGSTVSSAPSSIWAEFTEPLSEGSYLRVTDPCGERVDNNDTSISGYRMSVTLDSARAGEFVVSFRAVSAIDPHTVVGDFSFTATDGEPCPGEQSEEVSPSEEDRDRVDGGAGDGGSASTEAGTVEASGDGGQEGSAASDGGRSRTDAREGRERPRGGGAVDREDVREGADLAAAEQPTSEPPSIYDGIPWAPFGVSLAIAALIGAAGGKIYAGIMGPTA